MQQITYYRLYPISLFFPEKFLGRQIYSYGQLLTVAFASEATELLPSNVTLVLQGSGGTLTADMWPQPFSDHKPGLTPRRSFRIRYGETSVSVKT